MATNYHRTEAEAAAEEQEALFSSGAYPCAALFYVQSPSTTSHATNSDASDTAAIASRLALSRYSSRGSNDSFVPHSHHNIPAAGAREEQEHARPGLAGMKTGRRRLRVVPDDETVEEGRRRRSWVWTLISLDPSASCFCVSFQLAWRLAASGAVALLVFFLATRPPAPEVSFKVSRVRHFNLGEGLDATGVVTKILTCNSTVEMEIENKSKLFGLHVQPVTMEMAFGRLRFATSKGRGSYVQSDSSMKTRFYVGVKDTPMYGAGRNMQDMIESGRGLPLTVRLASRSSHHVVWNLIKSRYRHRADCLVILTGRYDVRRRTHVYNSTCFTTAAFLA